MCPFFEKKEKSIVFSLHISTKISTKKPSKLFCQPRPTPPPIFPTLPINNNYCNVQPPPRPLLFQPLLLFVTREYPLSRRYIFGKTKGREGVSN